jgi:hypothetical protein
MKAQNLYNAGSIVGCRFSFTLPVELPLRPDAAALPAEVASPLELTAQTTP